jgi:hypothetical protein
MTGPAYHFVKYATSGKFSGLDLLLFGETRNLDTVLLVIKCSPYLAKLNEGILRLRESGNTEQIISQFLVSTTTYREAVRHKLYPTSALRLGDLALAFFTLSAAAAITFGLIGYEVLVSKLAKRCNILLPSGAF